MVFWGLVLIWVYLRPGFCCSFRGCWIWCYVGSLYDWCVVGNGGDGRWFLWMIWFCGGLFVAGLDGLGFVCCSKFRLCEFGCCCIMFWCCFWVYLLSGGCC